MILKRLFLFSLIFCGISSALANENERPSTHTVKGAVSDENGDPIIGAAVYIKDIDRGVSTNREGKFVLERIPAGKHTLIVSYLGYKTEFVEFHIPSSKDYFKVSLSPDINEISRVEVFGERYQQPEKLEAITRMPLRPNEQIQSISVISEKIIEEQGALTVTDAARNVPGVTLFGSYGGVKESMSIRGYRGVPVLKNGVRVDSDFRTGSLLTDMQGVESIQVIKGSAAVTQGIGNDLGSAGGVINVVTKTPKFTDQGEVSLRAGSWGQVRPAFDVQTVLDKQRTTALRLNGAYERSDNYRPVINSNRVYVNPSFEWRPNDRTTVTLEMDYMNDNRTPYTSTVNLGPDTEDHLYDMPHSKFLGLRDDNVNTVTLSYAARVNHQFSDKLSLRASYFAAKNNTDNTSTGVSRVRGADSYSSERQRAMSRSRRDDRNSTFQLDFIGRDVYTGPVKHTFQVGFDYTTVKLATTSFNFRYKDAAGETVTSSSWVVDVIDVLTDDIPNDVAKPESFTLLAQDPVRSSSYSYGIMAQEVMTINQYVKAILGLRYSYISSEEEKSAGRTTGDAWNPMLGVMVTPIKNINLFGSYTTTTNLRSAANPLEGGGTVGASTTRQWEAGFKTEWLNDRLRFNFTYFDINTKNLSYSIYEEGTTNTTGYYGKAGDLKRRGVEMELAGRVLKNLQVTMGYAYLDAQYDNSPSYQNGSAPMNTPKHTANGWVYYTFDKGAIKGLSAGIGAYYVGKRPVNEWNLTPDGHGSMVGDKPFDMPSYWTMNIQLAYTFHNFTARVFFNNIFDNIGYNSYYRGGFINQIDPFNVAGSLTYRF